MGHVDLIKLGFMPPMFQPQKLKISRQELKSLNLPHAPVLSGAGSEQGKLRPIPSSPLQRSEMFTWWLGEGTVVV